jgi:hypothetical protein
MRNFFKFLILLFVFSLSCTNLAELKRKENPEFVNNSQTFIIASPIVPNSSVNKYILEDQLTNNVYDLEIQMEDSDVEIDVLDEDEIGDGIKTDLKEFSSHRFFISNPFGNKNYEVVGKTTFYRTKVEKEKTSSEEGDFVYPIEFWIYEEGKDVGKMRIFETSLGENKVFQRKITHLFHNKIYNLVFQDMMSKKSLVFEDENGLIALFGLKPKGTLTTKLTGEILIKKDLSDDLKSDIFSLYLMTEAALQKINERGI